MSQEPAGFNLPPADGYTPPAPKKGGLPLWAMILIGIVGLGVLGCGALVAIGLNPATQQANATAQAATAEANAAQMAADEELISNAEQLLDETFDDPEAIDITPGEGSTATIEGGIFEANLSENSQRSIFLDEPLTDMASEVECTVIEGRSDGGCGIIFGVNETSADENDQHYFFVSGGNYGMVTTTGSSENSWSKGHSAINAEEGATNLLRVVREGSEVRLYVNDVLVDRFASEELPEGGAGFAVSASDGNAVVQVDNFRLWQIN